MRWLVLFPLLALAACNPQPATYPADYERNFMTACERQGAANALCACTWDQIETGISPGDFAALERLPQRQREAHPLTTQINGYVEACNANLAPAPASGDDDVPPPP